MSPRSDVDPERGTGLRGVRFMSDIARGATVIGEQHGHPGNRALEVLLMSVQARALAALLRVVVGRGRTADLSLSRGKYLVRRRLTICRRLTDRFELYLDRLSCKFATRSAIVCGLAIDIMLCPPVGEL
jgi:hypothetical protein